MKKKSLKKVLFLCGFILAASTALLFNGDIFLSKAPDSQKESLQARFDRLLSGEGSELWKEQCALLQKDALQLIKTESETYRQKASSSPRIDEFTDEYFGYLKGFKFLYLGMRDAIGAEKNRIQDEIQEMLVEYIFFDLRDFQGDLQFGLEKLMEVHLEKYSENMIELLEENFDKNELEKILTEIKVNPISVAGSNIHSLVLTVAFLRAGKIGTSMVASTVGQKVVGAILSKIPGLTASICTAAGTFGMSILIDYMFSRTVKYCTSDTLRASLRSVIDSVVTDYRLSAEKTLLYALEAFTELRWN